MYIYIYIDRVVINRYRTGRNLHCKATYNSANSIYTRIFSYLYMRRGARAEIKYLPRNCDVEAHTHGSLWENTYGHVRVNRYMYISLLLPLPFPPPFSINIISQIKTANENYTVIVRNHAYSLMHYSMTQLLRVNGKSIEFARRSYYCGPILCSINICRRLRAKAIII